MNVSSSRTILWRQKGRKMPILKLSKDNENEEIEFELNYLKSLTTNQRFQMMVKKTYELINLLGKNGDRKTTQIIKRT